MKFRDPKTGEVFRDMYQLVRRFCRERNCDEKCPIDAPSRGHNCWSWAVDYPAEAARLMGYEMIEEEPMEQPDKPRICQVLGVEQAMEIITAELRGDKSPGSWYYSWQSNLACTIMDNADIDHDTANKIAIRFLDRLCASKPRFTEEEAEDAKALVRILGATQIKRTEYGGNLHAAIGDIAEVVVNQDLFPSLRSGQAVKLEDVIHATDR